MAKHKFSWLWKTLGVLTGVASIWLILVGLFGFDFVAAVGLSSIEQAIWLLLGAAGITFVIKRF